MDLNVAATVKVMPTGTDVDFKSIQKGIEDIVKKYGKVHSIEVKPMAFGLKSIEAVFLLNDAQGGIEEIEAAIGKLKGVGSIETLDVNRL
jgi:elongation factor 1-beta